MITSKRLLEQLHKERLECISVSVSARLWCAMQVQLDNIALEASKAETRYWKKRALAAEEKLQQRILETWDYRIINL
jgi:hypothetical protein